LLALACFHDGGLAAAQQGMQPLEKRFGPMSFVARIAMAVSPRALSVRISRTWIVRRAGEASRTQAVGLMPMFMDVQVSDQELANLAAYFASLPKPAQPGVWKTEVPANAPAGQRTMIMVGCGQCHATC